MVGDDFKDSVVEEGENTRVIKGSFSSPYHQGKTSTAKKIVKLYRRNGGQDVSNASV